MKIVSGGESGVDRAALDTAIALHIPYGGWVPKGGWAEDFPSCAMSDGKPVPTFPDIAAPPGLLAVYPDLTPTPSADPAERTARNVRDSDRTLILTGAGGLAASPGTALTVQIAEEMGRPHLVVNADDPGAAKTVRAWLADAPAGLVLNVGGPRESEAPGIYAAARQVLEAVLRRDVPP